jgi:hypothetical protein
LHSSEVSGRRNDGGEEKYGENEDPDATLTALAIRPSTSLEVAEKKRALLRRVPELRTWAVEASRA